MTSTDDSERRHLPGDYALITGGVMIGAGASFIGVIVNNLLTVAGLIGFLLGAIPIIVGWLVIGWGWRQRKQGPSPSAMTVEHDRTSS